MECRGARDRDQAGIIGSGSWTPSWETDPRRQRCYTCGLNEILQPHLDTVEYENLTEKIFLQQLESIKSILNVAIDEAKLFYASF